MLTVLSVFENCATSFWSLLLFKLSSSVCKVGEGNGNPLQCSCLENPRDGGARWAAVYGSHRVGHDWSDLTVAYVRCLSSKLSRFIFSFPKSDSIQLVWISLDLSSLNSRGILNWGLSLLTGGSFQKMYLQILFQPCPPPFLLVPWWHGYQTLLQPKRSL